MKSERRAATCELGNRRRWSTSFLACHSSSSIFAEPAAWQVTRMEALCLAAEKEGNFWLNGARVAEEERRGVAGCEHLGTKRWGRSNPQKLSGWRGGEKERWRRLCWVGGRLTEKQWLESVSLGERVAWRCRCASASSSDDVGEGVGVGDGTGEG